MDWASLGISVLAFAVSGTTLWLTYLNKGKLRMTKPTVVFFGPDGDDKGISKVFLRTLLYSTSKRGIVIEHLYVRLRRGETQQNFNIWVYGDSNLVRGSGLFVGQEGVAANHHFLTPNDTGKFNFAAGQYRLDVFCKVVSASKVELLSTIELKIDAAEAEKLAKAGFGIYFDWGPDSGQYQTKIEAKKTKPLDPMKMLESLHNGEFPELTENLKNRKE